APLPPGSRSCFPSGSDPFERPSIANQPIEVYHASWQGGTIGKHERCTARGSSRGPASELATLILGPPLIRKPGRDPDPSWRRPSEQAKNSKQSAHAAQPIPPPGRPSHRATDAVA